MKKNNFIATMTFHWATNYGAVLQAYALQKCLNNMGCRTELINYVPKRILLLGKLSDIKNFRWKKFIRERYISEFRKNELVISEEKFVNYNELCALKDQYAAIIVGSDQIWNSAFTMGAEKRPTLSYFLDFCGEETRRISYAASFGFDNPSADYVQTVAPVIKKFNNISVRENSGLNVLEQLGVQGELICDPTLLLEKEFYDRLANKSQRATKKVFSYILHENQKTIESIATYIERIYDEEMKRSRNVVCSVYDWLNAVRSAEVVVTNSFHGVMFALIFNTSFIVSPVEGAKMNDRIYTILKYLELEDRIIERYDEHDISNLSNDIKWDIVNERLNVLRGQGQLFLKEAIGIK